MADIEYMPGPLPDAARSTPTALWNDSPDLDELCQSISYSGAGAICNPVIVCTTIKKHLDVWAPRIQAIADANPTWGESEIGWKAVKGVSQKATKLLKPVFNEYKGRSGYLSVQTDPRFYHDVKKLAGQAEELHDLARNIVMKIPAAKTGFEAIEDTTSRGVSINVTAPFSMSQAMQAAGTIEHGLKVCEAARYNTPEIGPVVTIMVGRLDDWLKHVVARDGILIDPSALEWTDIAAMKRTHQIFQERDYHARMFAATLRSVNQWAEFVGGGVAISLPFKQQKIIADSDCTACEHTADPVNPHHIAKLEHIPDFVHTYELDGMTIEESGKFGPTRKALHQLLAVNVDLGVLVCDIIVPAP